MGVSQLFKYSVVRYVPDHIRDEPVNVGIVLRSAEGGGGRSRIAPSIRRRLRALGAGQESGFLADAVQDLVSEYPVRPLDMLEKKYSHKIRITEPRAIMVEDLDRDADMLYERFVGVRTRAGSRSGVDPSILHQIRRHAWGLTRGTDGADRNVQIRGRSSSFRFDLRVGGSPRLVHFVCLRGRRSLRAVRLLDWHISDITGLHGHDRYEFVPVLVYDTGDQDVELRSCRDEALRILESGGRHVCSLDARDWRAGLGRILCA
ncbi:hypothetical protein IBTHAUMO2_410007 [Nitrosopumilaceae archaeon]|nr:DUF3037 domain-containing protein [Nitrosopumilus sp.]MDA7944417.1 DUF3037 domain-containing protein [Nitrosopumilus sp.]MDA7954169.1 DUF3037 domain-containing protein [Nitrosopumilus sp.]MDA7973235.1 DUF3037 domain-containing protein [Nitrosopumilus sp.]CAI9831760.1 hypothetical protein IBTHAUMO2_410007 [Nitrosopumilaceae archaeon]